ncbi:hypothetical protein J8281_08150 [Aquimarina sp. U1-2]|uniref:hypothetical protein n=1 Tax=Aquimarina sp. U1-2 TaxID=2823141 RepID=UPI001AECAFDA|nr:hypothetical protein [Aquimarina sp. U1-2]MBP2832158.1 hypothetical protein [Aquimarina sp. U1-2]
MKSSVAIINIVLIISIALIPSISSAQILYEDQLETVYLNHKGEEVVYTNNFSQVNNSLIALDDINFRIEIKKAKENNSYLLFLSERSNLEIPKAGYLKTIRKGANRSTNVRAFENYLNEKLPELINQFRRDNNLEELYITSRKNTFNGKIDSLPSVISIDF